MGRKIGKATIMIALFLLNIVLGANLTIVKTTGTIHIRADDWVNPQGTSTILYVDPSVTYARVGEEVKINITIADVVDLYAWQVGLNFDPSMLSFTEVSFLGPFPWTLGPSNYTTPGIILIGATMLGQVPGFNGTTVLATITFKAIASGVSDLIIRYGPPCTLWRSILIDSTQPPGDIFREIPFTSQDGRVEIQEALYTYEKEGLEKLDQHAADEKWGNCWCVPTSAGISLGWFAENGYPDLIPDINGDGIDEDDKYAAIRDLAVYMRTGLCTGTTPRDLLKGLQDYINDAGYGDDFTVKAIGAGTLDGPRPTYQDFIDELTAGEDVLVLYPWHCVVGRAANENPPPQNIGIVDPWTGEDRDTTWDALRPLMLVSVSPVSSPKSYDAKLYGYVVEVAGNTYVINGTTFDEVYVVDGQVFGVPQGTVYNTTGIVYGFANKTVIIENGTYFPVMGSIYIINGTQSFPPLDYVYPPDNDITIRKVRSTKTIVGHGYSVPIDITVHNTGNQNTTFILTLYVNNTTAQNENVTLLRGTQATITFTWNTTSFAKGNYTIWAYAWPVPGETDTADNTFVDGWVFVAMVGDITGPDGWPDGKVDIRDVAKVSRIYGTLPGMPGWDPNCDINNDQKVDIKDVAAVSKQYGKIDP
jgi:hypothetical protein